MIAALALLLVFSPGWGNDLFSLSKMTVVCAAVFVDFWREPPTMWPSNDVKPWAVLAAALAVSTFFSWDLGYSLVSTDHSRGLGLLQWAVCGLLFVYGCNTAREGLDRALLWGGWAMATWACFQRASMGIRAGSTQGGPVVLGEMLVVCLPAIWRLNRGVAAVLVLGVAASGCRSALLAMAVVAVYLWRTR